MDLKVRNILERARMARATTSSRKATKSPGRSDAVCKLVAHADAMLEYAALQCRFGVPAPTRKTELKLQSFASTINAMLKATKRANQEVLIKPIFYFACRLITIREQDNSESSMKYLNACFTGTIFGASNEELNDVLLLLALTMNLRISAKSVKESLRDAFRSIDNCERGKVRISYGSKLDGIFSRAIGHIVNE